MQTRNSCSSIDQVLAIRLVGLLRFRLNLWDGIESLPRQEITHVLIENEPQHAVGEGGELEHVLQSRVAFLLVFQVGVVNVPVGTLDAEKKFSDGGPDQRKVVAIEKNGEFVAH